MTLEQFAGRAHLQSRSLMPLLNFDPAHVPEEARTLEGWSKDGWRFRELLARRVLYQIEKYPAEPPRLPEGHLYYTANVRMLDQAIEHGRAGRWSKIYGSPGTQKTFTLRCRLAEAAKREQTCNPSLIWVYVSYGMSARALLARIALRVGAYAVGSRYTVMDSILTRLRDFTCAVLLIDEAQHLGSKDARQTIEVLRELGDLSGIGLVLLGHDHLESIFARDGKGPLQQFADRISYSHRLPGLDENEAREIIKAEVPDLDLSEEKVTRILDLTMRPDPWVGPDHSYRSMRVLMDVLRQLKERT